MRLALLSLGFGLFAGLACGDPAVIERVDARDTGSGWTFDVTLSHTDTGWDDYADGWRVVAEDGTEYGYRELLHPHVNEQPFTRSLTGISIPNGTARVFVETRTSVEGWDDTRFPVDLTR